MTDCGIWLLDKADDGGYDLYAPNGVHLFHVSPETLAMLGQMFLDEVEAEEDEP